MRIIAYKMITHSNIVGFFKFKDGNKLNLNKSNLINASMNDIINDIKTTGDKTNWDILLTNEEKAYIKKNPYKLIKYFNNNDL